MLNMDHVTALGALGMSAVAGLPKCETWKPGDKLKILLVGYNGKRNTGADVRVVEMVKQINRALGEDRIEISVLTLDVDNIKDYFDPSTNLIEFSTIYFKDLLDACSQNHMAVLCEGSTLKSRFANALTLFFCEAAGVMKKQGKPCIAYGSEAGEMDEFIRKAASNLCSDTYFIARTEPSLKIIEDMGLKGHLGTDTAWTFPPADRAWAEEELREKTGWDGKKPILGVAVINPFYWPVKPSLVKLAKSAVTRTWEKHYEKWYFFSWSEEREKAYRAYMDGIADAVNRFRADHDVHVVIIGMEALDYDACQDLSDALDSPAGIFSSRFYDGHQMTAILHSLSMLVTSRYHARVLSMPGGVPCIAVSMDERLYNIFEECGHLEDYYFPADEPELGQKLVASMEKLWEKRDEVSQEILRAVPGYLKIMSDMGSFFREYVEESFPGIDLAPPPEDWLGYLPELREELSELL
ncbi:MAG: polysaccharide pyruvyl transferase family protein [Actinobacteria bacterium]|nr:polysaccharide pyruvyl transferase family protein [Actinomycetota bacterium]MCG2819780.1 polysaccharide pyruvyl transferase family protein [Actinomycetes bacterium]MBU4178332.1 polysaccharide pyruvyl transferase family protein [Actinomycetota bacterium]MBU4219284.1 polysaccharide pyruvyl transferase family protein [Actinomycetota bacterium]MBU4359568.1 polysaccharide pyruvyl transferase family protein [Actinomycetota bacterium]